MGLYGHKENSTDLNLWEEIEKKSYELMKLMLEVGYSGCKIVVTMILYITMSSANK